MAGFEVKNHPFNDKELGKIYRIMRLTYCDSCILAKLEGRHLKAVSRDDIQEATGLERKTFVPFWKKLLTNGVIKPLVINGAEFYCLSPLYNLSSDYKELSTYIAFQSEIDNFELGSEAGNE